MIGKIGAVPAVTAMGRDRGIIRDRIMPEIILPATRASRTIETARMIRVTSSAVMAKMAVIIGMAEMAVIQGIPRKGT